MFRPVESKPDFVAQEYQILEGWRDRRTFARLRAQNAGGPKWSFLDGPITANNPMGVHHAWGRAYKDLYQRFHAMLGEDQRYQNGFDCQGLWVEVNVERDLGFTSKRDIEAFGIARFVTLMASLEWSDQLHRIKCPTLVVYPGAETVGSTHNYDAMRDRIPDVEVISYEGLPHNICDSVPDRCVDDVLKFLEKRFGKPA